MERDTILDEIRRTAQDGRALGKERFARETGIRESDWSGKHWARWSDAIAEAGFAPNEMNQPYPTDQIVEGLVGIIEDLGKWPTNAERRLYKRRHPNSISPDTYYRLGNQYQQARAVLDYASKHRVSDEVTAICNRQAERRKPNDHFEKEAKTGFVYLLKSGRHYKIGHSNDPSRRAYEIRLQMPEQVSEVHRIETDDPVGVEAYWHRRFAGRRAEGEWFRLKPEDLKAFKSRNSM